MIESVAPPASSPPTPAAEVPDASSARQRALREAAEYGMFTVQCVLAAVRALTFPSPDGGGVVIASAPIMFSPR